MRFDGRTRLGKVYKEMAADCKAVVDEAIRTNEFTNRTHNLADSYGAALYYNGVLLPETIYYNDPKATTTKSWKDNDSLSGHDEMLRYLNTFRPRKSGLTLVLVAAMPYGDVLERGGGRLRRKYKVIVGANDLLRALANKYNGMFGRRRVARTSINVGNF